MVFQGFWLVYMVFQGSFMVFHGFWLVSMVFQGCFMVYHSFVGKRSRNAKNEFQKYKNAKKQILLKKSINRGCGSQTCHSITDIHHDWTGCPKYPASEGENNRRRTVPVCGLL